MARQITTAQVAELLRWHAGMSADDAARQAAAEYPDGAVMFADGEGMAIGHVTVVRTVPWWAAGAARTARALAERRQDEATS